MHELKYAAIAWTPIEEEDRSEKDFRNTYLHPIARSFITNLTRTSRFALMPAQLAVLTRNQQLWDDYIDVKLGRQIDPYSRRLRQGFSDEEEKIAKPIVATFARQTPTELRDLIDNIGITFVEENIRSDPHMRDAMTAILSTIILESWTAFEILASDLWATAVDQGPKDIRNRLMLSKKLLAADDQITADKIHELEYDSRQLGSFLREVGKVSFQKLDYIRRFYSAAFGKETDELFEKTEDGYVFALAAFRNMLVHNAGKADKRFLKTVSRFAEFRSIKQDDVVLLDGEIVRKLNKSAVVLGWKLIAYVDKVLTSAPAAAP